MKESLKLPIHIENVESVTDCWIYNKLAILKTSPYYKDWVASHYNLYSTRDYNFSFGDVWIYPSGYHEEILHRKPVRLFDLTEENVVKSLKEQLKNGYYMIFTLKPYKEYEYFHELLFYGFDDEKEEFLTVGLKNRAFGTVALSYKHMQDTIEDVKTHFYNNEKRAIELSLNFQYPITALKLNESYKTDNCALEAYYKLKREFDGGMYKVFDFYGEKTDETGFRGMACLQAFKEMLEKEVKGEEFTEWFRGFSSAAKKLLEHHTMIKYSMDYVIQKWDKALTDKAKRSADNYAKTFSTLEKWLNLCLKYECTNDKNILKRIISEIPTLFLNEIQNLNIFVNEGINWKKYNIYYV